MAVYTVHEPPRRSGDLLAHAERFVFVRDAFSWGAFVFGPLWFLRHQLWLALVSYLGIAAALFAALSAIEPASGVSVGVGVLVALLLGIEGSSLRRWALERRRWRNVGVVVGDDIESAERRFFAAWLAHEQGPRLASGSTPAGRGQATPASSDVIGLFPQAGARA